MHHVRLVKWPTGDDISTSSCEMDYKSTTSRCQHESLPERTVCQVISAVKTRAVTRRKSCCKNRYQHYCHLVKQPNQAKMASFLLHSICQLICLIVLLAQVCTPTSNINSVWLSKDTNLERSNETPGGQIDKRSALFASSATVNADKRQLIQNRANDYNRKHPNSITSDQSIHSYREPHQTQLLQAASSSLHPSIVPADGAETNSNRRSDLDSSALADDQATGDRVQLINGGQVSNEQVQFDERLEELSAGLANASRSRPASANSKVRRQQDGQNKTTSAPLRELSPESPPSVAGLDEEGWRAPAIAVNIPNYSLGSFASGIGDNVSNRHDYHAINRSSQSEAGDNAGQQNGTRALFYNYSLGDSGQWTPATLGEPLSEPTLAPLSQIQVNGPRRSVHSSGTQYDLREHQVAPVDGGASSRKAPQLAYQAGAPEFGPDDGDPLGYNLHEREPVRAARRPAQVFSGQQTPHPTTLGDINQGDFYLERPADRSQSTSYKLIGAANHDESKYLNLATTLHQSGLFPTTPMPFVSTLTHNPIESGYLAGERFVPLTSYPASGGSGTALLSPRHVYRASAPKMVPVDRPANGNSVYEIGPIAQSRRANAASNRLPAQPQQRHHVDQSRRTLGGADEPSRNRLFTRTNNGPAVFGYIRSPSAASSSPSLRPSSSSANGKRSLLGALSNRLNHWVDASRSQNSLESSFYESPREFASATSHQLIPGALRRLRASQAAQAAHWNAANYYHIQDNFRPVSLASVLPIGHTPSSYPSQRANPLQHHFAQSSMASNAFVRPQSALFNSATPAEQQQQQQQHHFGLIRPSLNYYPSLDGQSSHGNYMNALRSIAVQQPTVAPAPSVLERFYGSANQVAGFYQPTLANYAGQRQRRRHRPIRLADEHLVGSANLQGQLAAKKAAQHPAGFIPVVAVSVTKTSPAPKSAPNQAKGAYQQQQANGGEQASDAAAEIDHYLNMKQLQASQSARERQRGVSTSGTMSINDYGNLASGSALSQDAYARKTKLSAPFHLADAGAQEQTTTVKSAVFGYMPQHQVDTSPLLQAINILPQYAPPPASSRYASHLASASDAYANQESPLVVQPSESLDGSTSGEPALTTAPLEEPPSLTLQLQANNFAQNDIAHPFFDASQIGQPKGFASANPDLTSHYQQQQQQHYASRASHLANAPLDVYPASQDSHHYQIIKPDLAQAAPYLNPLLATEAIQQSLRNSHLVAAASDLNHNHNHLLPVVLANPESVRQFPQVTLNAFAQQGGVGQQAASGIMTAPGENNADESSPTASHSHTSAGASRANSVSTSTSSSVLNKGNKKRSSDFFASAGQLLLSALPLLLAPTLGLMFASSPSPVARYHGPTPFSSSSSSSGGGNGIPGTYINSLNSGLVSNASPAPKLFTPTPPNYHLMMANISTTTSKPANRATSTSKAPSLTPPASNKNKTSSSHKAQIQSVELTTLGPPPLVDAAKPSDQQGNGSIALFGQTISGPTILMLSDDDQDGAEFGADSSKMKNHHYDIGAYEGADFDTQFANLKKKQQQNKQQQQQQQRQHFLSDSNHGVNRSDNGYLDQIVLSPQVSTSAKSSASRGKHHYHYSEVISSPDVANDQRNSSNMMPLNSSSLPTIITKDDEVSTKLYPVSTWPPMRRRTVSLVTSNGNKTLLDSSERYSDLGMYSSSYNLIPSSSNIKYNTPSEVQRNNSNVTGEIQVRNGTDSSKRDGAMEFLLTDGVGNYATVSLTDEQDFDRQGSSVRRSKREVVPTVGDLDLSASSSSLADIQFTTRKKVKLMKKPKKSSGESKTAAKQTSQSDQMNNQQTTENSTNPDDVGNIANTYPSGASNYRDSERPGDLSTTSVIENNNPETLKSDATKSKSAHIITTTITRVEDSNPGEQDEERKTGEQTNDDYQQGDTGYYQQEMANNELLGEQLIKKKVVLEKMARKHPRSSRNRYREPPEQHEDSQQSSVADLSNFSAGGRGHFPPSPTPPVEFHSTKTRLYPNDSSAEQPTRTHRPAKETRRGSGSQLTLADDTKRALVNLSSLLMKDSLQRDDLHSSTHRYKKANRNKQISEHDRRRYNDPRSANSDERYELYEGSATERSVSMTTPVPEVGYGVGADEHAFHSGAEPEYRREPPTYYSKIAANSRRATYPPSGSYPNHTETDYNALQSDPIRHGYGHNLSHLANNQLGPEPGEFAALSGVSDRVNLIEPEPAPYSPGDERSMSDFNGGGNGPGTYTAPDNKYAGNQSPGDRYKPESPLGQYMYALTQANGLNRSVGEGESAQFGYSNHSDRRTEPNGLYSRPPEPYIGAYSNAHYSDPSRRPQVAPQQHQQQQHRPYNYEPNVRNYPPQRETHYAIGEPVPPNNHLYNGTTYAPMYHNHKPASSSHYNREHEYPSNYNSYNHHPGAMYGAHQRPPPPPPQQPPPQPQYPVKGPLEYNAPQREYYTPKYNRDAHYPVDSSPYGSPSASVLPYQGASVTAFGEKSHSHAVTDYLKRVQFTDSDRDKLMASYLTCDGLLNDNDHCLERLSCEFSDPQNIEKANKLDRAVSSILLGHILINTYIPNQFKLRLKSASLFGYTHSGKCSRFVCNKLAKPSSGSTDA